MIYMKTIKIMSIAVLALAMAACSNDTEQPAAVQTSCPGGGIPFSATITTGSQTRALTENTTDHTLDAAWATGEKVALVYGETLDEVTVTRNDDGTATITGSLTGSPKQGDAVTVIYPASAVDATTKAVKTNLLSAQDGTLATIATSLDLRQSDGATLTVGAGHASLNGTVILSNQIAIVKFSLSDGNNALAAKQFVIKDGSDNVLTTVTPSEATSNLYVAMAPATNAAAFKFEATVGDFTYTYEKSGVILEASTYYQSPIKMTISKKAGEISFATATPKEALHANAADNTFTQEVTNTGDGTVTYTISDNTCGATIDASTGKVTFTQAGSVTITATVADGTNYTYATKTATYTLSVSDATDGSGGVPDNDDYTGGGNPF